MNKTFLRWLDGTLLVLVVLAAFGFWLLRDDTALETPHPAEEAKTGTLPQKSLQPQQEKGSGDRHPPRAAASVQQEPSAEEMAAMSLREAMKKWPLPGVDPDKVLGPDEGYDRLEPRTKPVKNDEEVGPYAGEVGYTRREDAQATVFQEEANHDFPLRSIETYNRRAVENGQLKSWTEIWIRAGSTPDLQLDELMSQVCDLYRELSGGREEVRVMHWVGGQPRTRVTFPALD